MLSEPKLIKNESAVQKQFNAKKEKKGNARFIMGLNNRVAKLDDRLDRLESNLSHSLSQQIGYKELALTLILALLIFTSVILAIREALPKDSTIEDRLISRVLEQPESRQKNTLLSFLSALRTHPPSGEGSRIDKEIDLNISLYRWPLEKQSPSKDIQYSKHKHGIQISAQLGDPVVAIAKGKVIYSGNAISGYGNLILIQHKNDIISVYGNNYTNYIKENDEVLQGELIAAAGETNGNSAKLYFEMRFKGKAEDPFLYF